MKTLARAVFGAHGQLAVGVLTLIGAAGSWVYGSTLTGEALIRFLFHISMAFGCVACYAIVSNALGYRATERVEAKVVEDIEHAAEVNVAAEEVEVK